MCHGPREARGPRAERGRYTTGLIPAVVLRSVDVFASEGAASGPSCTDCHPKKLPFKFKNALLLQEILKIQISKKNEVKFSHNLIGQTVVVMFWHKRSNLSAMCVFRKQSYVARIVFRSVFFGSFIHSTVTQRATSLCQVLHAKNSAYKPPSVLQPTNSLPRS